jgi:photoactive yellow protein
MTDPSAPQRDRSWYENRWDELCQILSVEAPDDVLPRVRELQLDALQDYADAAAEGATSDEMRRMVEDLRARVERLQQANAPLERICSAVDASSPAEAAERVDALVDRVQTLEAQREELEEAGVPGPAEAAQMIESMEDQLLELYQEKEATERSGATGAGVPGDTFDQLQALLAREEKLQRELGVSSSEEIIEMVNGLAEQLEELYAARETGGAREAGEADVRENGAGPPAASGERVERLKQREQRLENELGVSDPDEVIAMVRGLGEQLSELYAVRERLQEVNLDSADSAVEMIQSMEAQLESLYESQERMAAQGIQGAEHAVRLIESMEAQLNDIYDERRDFFTTPSVDEDDLASGGDGGADGMSAQLQDLIQSANTLVEAREVLERKLEAYRDQMDTLEQQFGTDDPERIAELVHSMEEQLNDVYQERDLAQAAALSEDAFASDETLRRIDRMSGALDAADLDTLPLGAFCVDPDGTVRAANASAADFPGINAGVPDGVTGANFFSDLAPSTNNDVFRGRFDRGAGSDALDERFVYTVIPEDGSPANLAVHLYRSADADAYWILFRRL